MPGVNIGWDSSTPPGSESASIGASRIRSMKTAIQQSMDAEHVFAASGGAGTGIHRRGSAVVNVGLQSLVSSGDTEGRMYYASDTSQTFATPSTGTVLVGGPAVVSMGSFPADAAPQRFQWVDEVVTAFVPAGSGNTTITWPRSGFSGIPFVSVSCWSTLKPDTSGLFAIVESQTATQCIIKSTSVIGGVCANASRHTLIVWSRGTRAL